jgi:hypothetical protein
MEDDRYEITYEGGFMAAFNNNGETRYYIEKKLNEGGFFPEDFAVTKNGDPLTVEARYSVSIGGAVNENALSRLHGGTWRM